MESAERGRWQATLRLRNYFPESGIHEYVDFSRRKCDCATHGAQTFGPDSGAAGRGSGRWCAAVATCGSGDWFAQDIHVAWFGAVGLVAACRHFRRTLIRTSRCAGDATQSAADRNPDQQAAAFAAGATVVAANTTQKTGAGAAPVEAAANDQNTGTGCAGNRGCKHCRDRQQSGAGRSGCRCGTSRSAGACCES